MHGAERDSELAKLYGSKGKVAFDNQIRTYGMHPNQLVGDHPTAAEKGNRSPDPSAA